MQAIETVYKGYRFRSRLEARWAVFFKELDIKFQYETEGFDLEKAGYYLPDFYLDIRITWAWFDNYFGGTWNSAYLEIKHEMYEDNKNKLSDISDDMDFFLFKGDPANINGRYLSRTTRPDFYNPVFFYDNGGEITLCIFPNRQDLFEETFLHHQEFLTTDRIYNAVIAARQSRFEYGQFGPPARWHNGTR